MGYQWFVPLKSLTTSYALVFSMMTLPMVQHYFIVGKRLEAESTWVLHIIKMNILLVKLENLIWCKNRQTFVTFKIISILLAIRSCSSGCFWFHVFCHTETGVKMREEHFVSWKTFSAFKTLKFIVTSGMWLFMFLHSHHSLEWLKTKRTFKLAVFLVEYHVVF